MIVNAQITHKRSLPDIPLGHRQGLTLNDTRIILTEMKNFDQKISNVALTVLCALGAVIYIGFNHGYCTTLVATPILVLANFLLGAALMDRRLPIVDLPIISDKVNQLVNGSYPLNRLPNKTLPSYRLKPLFSLLQYEDSRGCYSTACARKLNYSQLMKVFVKNPESVRYWVSTNNLSPEQLFLWKKLFEISTLKKEKLIELFESRSFIENCSGHPLLIYATLQHIPKQYLQDHEVMQSIIAFCRDCSKERILEIANAEGLEDVYKQNQVVLQGEHAEFVVDLEQLKSSCDRFSKASNGEIIALKNCPDHMIEQIARLINGKSVNLERFPLRDWIEAANFFHFQELTALCDEYLSKQKISGGDCSLKQELLKLSKYKMPKLQAAVKKKFLARLDPTNHPTIPTFREAYVFARDNQVQDLVIKCEKEINRMLSDRANWLTPGTITLRELIEFFELIDVSNISTRFRFRCSRTIPDCSDNRIEEHLNLCFRERPNLLVGTWQFLKDHEHPWLQRVFISFCKKNRNTVEEAWLSVPDDLLASL